MTLGLIFGRDFFVFRRFKPFVTYNNVTVVEQQQAVVWGLKAWKTVMLLIHLALQCNAAFMEILGISMHI